MPFAKGYTQWNKGKSAPQIGNALRGRKSPWASKTCKARVGDKHPLWGKKRSDLIGKNNHNWKGGKSLNGRYNNKYFLWRKRVFYRDNFTCQVCFVRGGNLHADHIKSYADYPNLRYRISNGRTLCVPCHYYVTFKRKLPKGIFWGLHPSRGIESF